MSGQVYGVVSQLEGNRAPLCSVGSLAVGQFIIQGPTLRSLYLTVESQILSLSGQ